MNKEKILITGANGFIGSFLVSEAKKLGLDVYASVRKDSDISSINHLGVCIIEFDYHNVQMMANHIKEQRFDYIIHNAGITKSPDSSLFMKVNRDLLVNLIEGIKISGVEIKKLVLMSSLAAFGPADKLENKIVKETSIPKPVTYYGVSKLAAETFLKTQTNIPYVIIRPTAVYGPKDKEFLSVFKMIKIGFDLQPGLEKQQLTFIFVEDLAKVVINAALIPHQNKSYFVTDGKIYTSDAFTGLIKKQLKKRTFNLKVPIPIVKGLAFIMERFAGLLGSYPILNMDKVNELEARNWNCDISGLVADTGFVANYDLNKGVEKTIQWYKSNNWL